MSQFLTKFRSGLKELQGKQVLGLITREKEKGNISTVEEFKTRLSELTKELTAEKIKPTLSLYKARFGDYIDSDSFNFMIERINDDLITAFAEANTIDEVIDSHETIINDVVLKNLELMLNELEAQIQSLDFVKGTDFDRAVYNTFRITQNSRAAIQENVIFTDPKTLLMSIPGNEANIDLIGEKLILGQDEEKEHLIVRASQFFDTEAPASELNVAYDNSLLLNIADSKIGTFWVQSILLSEPRDEQGVQVKIELDLGSVQTLNYIQIEPVLAGQCFLNKISYVDENSRIVDVLTVPVELNSTNKFFFSRIAARRIQISFLTRDYFFTEFEIKPDGPVAVSRTQASDLTSPIRTDLLELVSSPASQQALGLNNINTKYAKYYEYLFGLDNIRLGSSLFKETSIFVSPVYSFNTLGQVAVKTLCKRPSNGEYTENTQPQSISDFFQGSFEFYIFKRDFDEFGKILNTNTYPIQPRNFQHVRHERLVLTKKTDPGASLNDVGFLQLYTADAATEIYVYRNGSLIDRVDIDPINGWILNTIFTNNTPETAIPMRTAIQIQNPNPSDIYTVSYTPTAGTSTTKPVNILDTDALMVDLDGRLDAWLAPDKSIYFSSVKNGTSIKTSKINLVIVLRRNTSDVTLTPVVEEYFLATSSVDKNRFSGSV